MTNPILVKYIPHKSSSSSQQQRQHHRTIDEFYEEAHNQCNNNNNNTNHNKKKNGNFFFYTPQRLGYFVIFASLGLANTGDSAEIGSMGFLLANPAFREEVVQGQDGLVASATYVGMLLGGLFCGPVCDRMGRRSVLVGGLAMNAMAGILMAFTSTPYELVLCRFVLGLGIGMIVTCLLALTSEHAPSSSRGSYLNFVSSFWTIGAIWVAVLAYEMFGRSDGDGGDGRSWRLYCLINAIPSASSFIMVLCFVPESARYLGVNGKYQQATKVVNAIADSMGYVGDKMSEDEIKSQFPPSSISKKVYNEGRGGPWAAIQQSCRAYSNLFTNPSTRRRTIFVQGLWFFASFGTGTSLWIPRILSELLVSDNDVYLFSLLYACGSVPGILVAGWLLDKMERTRLLTIGFALTTCTLAGLALVVTSTSSSSTDVNVDVEVSSSSSVSSSPVTILILVCLFHSCLCLSWSTLSIISAETFPTEIRSTAMGVCSATGRIAFVMVHNIAPLLLLEKNHSHELVGLGCLSFGIGLLFAHYSRLPSHTGAPLKDVAVTTTTNTTVVADAEVPLLNEQEKKQLQLPTYALSSSTNSTTRQ